MYHSTIAEPNDILPEGRTSYGRGQGTASRDPFLSTPFWAYASFDEDPFSLGGLGEPRFVLSECSSSYENGVFCKKSTGLHFHSPTSSMQSSGHFHGHHRKLSAPQKESVKLGSSETTVDDSDRHHAVICQRQVVEPNLRREPMELPTSPATSIMEVLVALGSLQPLAPAIQSKIQGGFFLSDGHWTCYRRNYFAVTCSFSLCPGICTLPVCIQRSGQCLESIRGFAMSISTIVDGEHETPRAIVQHTPQRDKKSERKPPPVRLQPLPIQGKISGGSYAGIQTQSEPFFCTMLPQACDQIETIHKFERCQFQNATVNNAKCRSGQQFYKLVINLHAEVTDAFGDQSQWVTIGRKYSDKLIVRGRSPQYYLERLDNLGI